MIYLCDYFDDWICNHKEGVVRAVTLKKYRASLKWLRLHFPKQALTRLDRAGYQKIINTYAQTHESATVRDFHTHIKACLLDAFEEGDIKKLPTRKIVLKGKPAKPKKIKYLDRDEVRRLVKVLNDTGEADMDFLIVFLLKTGLRFAEALAITPKDIDFQRATLNINKTWDYKTGSGFIPTKNKSSERMIYLDCQLVMALMKLCEKKKEDELIFKYLFDLKNKDVRSSSRSGNLYNSTINAHLARRCELAEVPVISIHGLRHTHASILLYSGATITSIAQRLGHCDGTVTQKTYLHVIKELERKDAATMLNSLAFIC